MNYYGFLVWGQTLLALFTLGLAGVVVLWPFRSQDLPFLWLAAPLAGIPALGGSLLLLYYVGRLPFKVALPLSLALLIGAGGSCWLQGGRLLPSRKIAIVGGAAMMICAAWGVWTCSWSALRAGEPTLAICDGSDMFGYAMCADWMREHSAATPPRPDQVFEVLQYDNLQIQADRPAAFLLTAAAATARGTTALFSYDWASGVAVSAGCAGLAGLFAAGTPELALLILGAFSCSWLATSRCGYLGKTLGYPGNLLLSALYLWTWIRPSVFRITVLCLLGAAVALCLDPIVPPLVLGLLLGGILAGIALAWIQRRAVFTVPAESVINLRSAARAIFLFLAAAIPVYAAHRLLFWGGHPEYDAPWSFILPASLDLENAYAPNQVGAGVSLALAATFCWVNVMLAVYAWHDRNLCSFSYLLCTCVILVAWLLNLHGLFGFHGLLYPMVLVGAALVLRSNSEEASSLRFVTVAFLAAGLIALHMPQIYVSLKRYQDTDDSVVVIKNSEFEALRKHIGKNAVDVSLADWRDSLGIISELACHGVDVRLHGQAWDRTLANWAAWAAAAHQRPAQLPEIPEKGVLSIMERKAYSPTGATKYVSDRLKLVADRDELGFCGVHLPDQDLTWLGKGAPGFRLGSHGTSIDIYNGKGKVIDAHFLAWSDAPAGMDSKQEICYSMGETEGRQDASPEHSVIDLPLRLAPGINQLHLSFGEAKPGKSVFEQPMLLLTRLSLEEGPK